MENYTFYALKYSLVPHFVAWCVCVFLCFFWYILQCSLWHSCSFSFCLSFALSIYESLLLFISHLILKLAAASPFKRTFHRRINEDQDDDGRNGTITECSVNIWNRVDYRFVFNSFLGGHQRNPSFYTGKNAGKISAWYSYTFPCPRPSASDRNFMQNAFGIQFWIV